MADPFVAEIRIFPFNFAPRGWAWCDGQLLPISQNTALFSLLGTTYGGNGQSNFALPNMQGRMPMHPGQGPGLSPHDLGEMGGSDSVTLLESEIPSHSHVIQTGLAGDAAMTAASNSSALGTAPTRAYATFPSNSLTSMSPKQLATAGGYQPHNNLPPYLTTYFCIAMQGVFPARS
ncbi:phage tail protein [Diaphorobacter caeni]|uniref:phage tail protein n=1 Tax=Diaphorobacter caeni TaxID=2784387 RepID=UPI00188E3489|nr:tail fiber protein [Diaphorobacter caeni]MBF5004228.1 phage tail protein [Diaphorobacter caeni]